MNKYLKPVIKPDAMQEGKSKAPPELVNKGKVTGEMKSRAGLATNILFLSHPGIILPSSKQVWAERPSSVIILASSYQLGWLTSPSWHHPSS